MPSTPPSKPKDPIIEAQIERTLAKFKGISTPAMLATMRAELEEALSTHPVAVALTEQLREHPAPEHGSGEGLQDGVLLDDTARGGKQGG